MILRRLVMTRTKFEKVTKKRIMQNSQISRKNQLEVLIFCINLL